MGEALFEPMRKRGVVIAMINMPLESTADALAMRARGFDLEVVAFPNQVDVFGVGPARVGCMAGQWVQSFAASRALALAGAEVLMYFDVPEDIPMLRTRALENHVYVVGANADWGVIIGPDGTVLAQTSHEGGCEAVATIDLSGAANKAVAPKTDIFAERRVALYRF
jgi:predicted amidohydrolase